MTRHFFHGRSALPFLITTLVPALAFAQRSGSTIDNDRIFQALGVREGLTVCEIGAGDGALSIAVARAVGAGGRVYTSELGDDRVKTLRDKIAASGLPQISVIAGDATATNFPDGACDALFMRNVYHHFADPARMNSAITKAVRRGGRVAVVDFAPPGAEAASPAERDKDGTHGVTPESLSRELEEAGFETFCSELGDERWFMVVVTKPGQ